MGNFGIQSWTGQSHNHDNRTSYSEALRRLTDVAAKMRPSLKETPGIKCHHAAPQGQDPSTFDCDPGNEVTPQTRSLLEASGMICVFDVLAPCSTPAADTSAMDGFALASKSTAHASIQNPVKFRIAGILAAGAKTLDHDVLGTNTELSLSADPLCFEIMTGARFADHQYAQMDAVVKVEDVKIETNMKEAQEGKSEVRYIYVSAPVKHNQHRRPAGSDFCKGDLIVSAGTKIEPKHVMALTSVGISNIHVYSGKVLGGHTNNLVDQHKIKIGVLPTGSELSNLFAPAYDKFELEKCRQTIPDSNGPFAISTLKSSSASCQVEYLGPYEDQEQKLTEAFRCAFEDSAYDIVITSGGVSVGRFDLVRRVLETRFSAEIVFHGCRVRPGAPVLFALVKRSTSKNSHTTVIFGAPGNPLAAAMTIRFFVEPFLKLLQCNSACLGNLTQDTLLEAFPAQIAVRDSIRSIRKLSGGTSFLLAAREEIQDSDGSTITVLKLLDDQASYKIKPFSQADFWVCVPPEQTVVRDGDLLRGYSL